MVLSRRMSNSSLRYWLNAMETPPASQKRWRRASPLPVGNPVPAQQTQKQSGQRHGELVLTVPFSFCPLHPSGATTWLMNFKSKCRQKLGIDGYPDPIFSTKSVFRQEMKRGHHQHCSVQKACDKKLKHPICLPEVFKSRQGAERDHAVMSTISTPSALADHESSNHRSIFFPCPIYPYWPIF